MPEAIAPSAQPVAASGEALLAVKNAVKLGGSLAATWGVALAVRILLPRHLGPELFGPLTFADAFATLCFVPLSLGVELYIRKEVSRRPQHASDFFGGVLLLRALASALLFGAMALVLELTGRPPEVRAVVYLFGAAQLFVYLNTSLAALLHARGRVDGLSVVTVAAKLVWAGSIPLFLFAGLGLPGVALAFLLSEALKAAALWRLTGRALELRLRVDLRATLAALVASLPFYVNQLAQTAYSKLDVNVLAFTVDDAAVVGWYGAASTLAGLALLVTPLIGWVLTPYLSRELERSPAAFDEALRRSVQVVLAVAVPTALLLALGADVWIRLMFGERFAPAAVPLRLLAPTFALTYVNTLTAIALIVLGRGWEVTRTSLLGMLANLGLNLALAPAGAALWGPAGAALGCAAALVLTEALTAARLLYCVRGRSFDRRSLAALAGSLAAGAAANRRRPARRGPRPGRLVLAGGAYLLVAVGTGALPSGSSCTSAAPRGATAMTNRPDLAASLSALVALAALAALGCAPAGAYTWVDELPSAKDRGASEGGYLIAPATCSTSGSGTRTPSAKVRVRADGRSPCRSSTTCPRGLRAAVLAAQLQTRLKTSSTTGRHHHRGGVEGAHRGGAGRGRQAGRLPRRARLGLLRYWPRPAG
jgi:O-antigen/teichoic acid export membrane protein